jgi:hypothetical protein
LSQYDDQSISHHKNDMHIEYVPETTAHEDFQFLQRLALSTLKYRTPTTERWPTRNVTNLI